MSQTTCQLIGTSAVTSANIADGAVVNADVNASAGIADSKLTGTTCKAWVNFNGTGTVAIRASYNVSSITDNGVGDYTVNFTTALPDANYAVMGTSGLTTSNVAAGYVGANRVGSNGDESAPTTTACRINAVANSGNIYDTKYINVAIFR